MKGRKSIEIGDRVAFKHKGSVLVGEVIGRQRRVASIKMKHRGNTRQNLVNVPYTAIVEVV